jgi:hypothetical protein
MQANEIAACADPPIRPLIEIERAVQWQRTRVHRSCCEVRTTPGVARLAADIETTPVDGVRRSRRLLHRLREFGATRRNARRERKQRCTPHQQPAHDCPQPRQHRLPGAKLPRSAGQCIQAFAFQTHAMSILADRRVLATTCRPVCGAAAAVCASAPKKSERHRKNKQPPWPSWVTTFPGGTYDRRAAFLAYGESS